jgi:hypothetical protein
MLLTQIAYSTFVFSNPVAHGRTLPGTGKPEWSEREWTCPQVFLTLYDHVGVNSCAGCRHHAELMNIERAPPSDTHITYR